MPKLEKHGRFKSKRGKGIDATFKKGVNGLIGLIDKAQIVTLKDNAELESNLAPQKLHYVENLFQPPHELQNVTKNIISSTPHYTRQPKSSHFFGKNFSIFLSPIVNQAVNDEKNKEDPPLKISLQNYDNLLNEINSNKNNNLKSDDRFAENDQGQQNIRKSFRLSNKHLVSPHRSNIEDKSPKKSDKKSKTKISVTSPNKSSAQATKNLVRSPSIKEPKNVSESSIVLRSMKKSSRKLDMSPVTVPRATEKDYSSSVQKIDAKKTRIPIRMVSQVKAAESNNNLQANKNQSLNTEHETKSTTPNRNASLSSDKMGNKDVRNCSSDKAPEKTPRKNESKERENLKPNNSSKENCVINISSSDSLALCEENDSAYSDSSNSELVDDRRKFINDTPRRRNIPRISPSKGPDKGPESTPEKPPNPSISHSKGTLRNTDLDGIENDNRDNLLGNVSARKITVDKNIQTSITKEQNTEIEIPKDTPKEAESDWNTIMAEINSKKAQTGKNENQTSQNYSRKPLVVAHRQQPFIQLKNLQQLDSVDQVALSRLISNKESVSDENNPTSTKQNKMSDEEQREYNNILADILANDDDNEDQTSANDKPTPLAHSDKISSKATTVDQEIQTSITKEHRAKVEKLKNPSKEPESTVATKSLTKKKQQKPRRFTCVDTISAAETAVNENFLKTISNTDVKKPRAAPKENEREYNNILADILANDDDNEDQTSANDKPTLLAHSDKISSKATTVDQEIQTSITKEHRAKVEKLKNPSKEPESTVATKSLTKKKQQKPRRFTCVDTISAAETAVNENFLKTISNTDVKKPRAAPKENESGSMDEINTKNNATNNETVISENQRLKSLVVTHCQQQSVTLGKPQTGKESKGLTLDSFDQFALLHLLRKMGSTSESFAKRTLGDGQNQASTQQKDVGNPTEMCEEAQSDQNAVMPDLLAAASSSNESETTMHQKKKQQPKRFTFPDKMSTRESDRNIQTPTLTEHNTKNEKPKVTTKENQRCSDWSRVLAEIAAKEKRPYIENRRSLFYHRKLFVRSHRINKYIRLEEDIKPKEIEGPASQEITSNDDEGSRDPFSDAGSSGRGSHLAEDCFNFVLNNDTPIWDVYRQSGDQVKSSNGASKTPTLVARLGSDPTQRRHRSGKSFLSGHKNLNSSSSLESNDVTIQNQIDDHQGEADDISKKKLEKPRASIYNRKGYKPFPFVQQAEEMDSVEHRRRSRKQNKNKSSTEDCCLSNDNTIIPVSSSDQELLGVRPFRKIKVIADVHLPSSNRNKSLQVQHSKSSQMLNTDNNRHFDTPNLDDVEVMDNSKGSCSLRRNKNTPTTDQHKITSLEIGIEENDQHHNSISLAAMADVETSSSSPLLHRNKNTSKRRKRKSSEISNENINQYLNNSNLDAIEVMANSDKSNSHSSGIKSKRQKRVSSKRCTEDKNSSEIINKGSNQHLNSSNLDAIEVMANSDKSNPHSSGIKNKRQQRLSSKRCTEDRKSSEIINKDSNQHLNSSNLDAIEVMANSDLSNPHSSSVRPKRNKRVSSKRCTNDNNEQPNKQTKGDDHVVPENNSRIKHKQGKSSARSAEINTCNILTTTDGRRPQRNKRPVRLLVDIILDEATLLKWSEEEERKKENRFRKGKKQQKALTPQPGKSNRTTGKGSKNIQNSHSESSGNSEMTNAAPEKRGRSKKTEKVPKPSSQVKSSHMPTENSQENMDHGSNDDEIMQPPITQEQMNGSPERYLAPENKPKKREGRSRKTEKVPKASIHIPTENTQENRDIASDEIMQPPTILEQADGSPERHLAGKRNDTKSLTAPANVVKKRGRPRKTKLIPDQRNNSPVLEANGLQNMDIVADEIVAQPSTSRVLEQRSPERRLDPSPPLCHKEVDKPMENQRTSPRNGKKNYRTLTSDSGVDTLHTMDNTNKRDLTHSNMKKQTLSKTTTNNDQLLSSSPEEENIPSVPDQSLRTSRLEFDTTSTERTANKDVAETEQEPWQKGLNCSRNFELSASSWQEDAKDSRNSSTSSIQSIQNEHINYVHNCEPIRLKFAHNKPSEAEYSRMGNLLVTQSATLKNAWSAGHIRLQPGDRKRTTVAAKYSFIYSVLKGQAWVRCNNRTTTVYQEGFFVIPVGTEYSIRNIDRHAELIMSYTKVHPHLSLE